MADQSDRTRNPSTNSSRNTSTNVVTFQEAIAHLPSSFDYALLAHAPSLSKMELKVCALTRLNFASGEIGAMLGIAQRTVDNHRYAIRKKLGLGEGQHLNAELIRLTPQETDENPGP